MKITVKLLAILSAFIIASGTVAYAAEATPDEVFIKHDVNMDGVFNIKDATDLQLFIAGIGVSVDRAQLDANYDKKINIKDSTRMQKLLAGIVDDPIPGEIGKEEEDIGDWF